MPHYNQDQAKKRHYERRERLQKIRNEFTDMLNDYWASFPSSEQEERNLEYRIEERLSYLHREVDRFISDFRRYPNS